MKLEVGKYYKTRGGERVGPMEKSIWSSLIKGKCGVKTLIFNISDGTHGDMDSDCVTIENKPNLDIIAEWQEQETTTPDFAALAKLHGICITVRVGGVVVSYDGRTE